MIRTDLIDIINKGGVWAFVGSGPSIDSGCPNWDKLVSDTVARAEASVQSNILEDSLYQEALLKKEYPKCFSRIAFFLGRDKLNKIVIEEIKKFNQPGKIYRLLADWPFAGYITSNYDDLIEASLTLSKQYGWSSVGNINDEIKKISRDVSNVVWHIHGSAKLPEDKSKLILTEEDYDDFYLDDTEIKSQLKSLLSQRRLVLVGFGFNDIELKRLLKLVGKLTNPSRPIIAFIDGLDGQYNIEKRKELLEKYNIDVIPYNVVNSSHEQLLELFRVYSSFVLRRSLKFGLPERPCPSYFPETTGLLIYNELCLRGGSHISENILAYLLKARVLSFLKSQGPCSLEDIVQDLEARAKAIRGDSVDSDKLIEEINKVIKELNAANLVATNKEETGPTIITLSAQGQEFVAEQSGTASRLEDQFFSSLKTRAEENLQGNEEGAERVAKAAKSFLLECVDRRALGVALTQYAWQSDFQSYHMVALLQELPKFIQQLASSSEATALINLVEGVLSNPSAAEAKYIGISLQAKFGVHLLGFDPDTLRARVEEISKTFFLIDSSTLIPFLAKDSIEYNSAKHLVDHLQRLGSFLATTKMLVEEVAEHARWAFNKVDSDKVLFGTNLGIEVLKTVTGRGGERHNAFLDGFVEDVSKGIVIPNFEKYMLTNCETKIIDSLHSTETYDKAFERKGIKSFKLQDFNGFSYEIWAERDEKQAQITERRKAIGTFRHDRQTRAEAEALIIIKNIRKKEFKIINKDFSNAYFISNTRIIDEISETNLPITMRLATALQWLATITSCGIDELSFLFNNLLGELLDKGFEIVDKGKLQNSFSHLIDASKEKLEEEIETHKVLISQRYGENAIHAFNETSLLEKPFLYCGYYAQKAEALAMELEAEKKKQSEDKRPKKIEAKERDELERLRMKEKERRDKALSKKRAAKSSKKKRRKRKREVI